MGAKTLQITSRWAAIFFDMTYLKDAGPGSDPVRRQRIIDEQKENRNHVGTIPRILAELIEHSELQVYPARLPRCLGQRAWGQKHSWCPTSGENCSTKLLRLTASKVLAKEASWVQRTWEVICPGSTDLDVVGTI